MSTELMLVFYPKRLRLATPRTGGSVWPQQYCPAFTARNIGLYSGCECWFCRYGDFRLRERIALEVGICCWPKEQIH